MSDLLVERIGGFGGFGPASSPLQSRGRCDLDDLPAADRKAIEALFAKQSAPLGSRAGYRLIDEQDFVKGDGMDYFLIFESTR